MSYVPKFNVTAHLVKIIEEIASFREKVLSSSIQVPWIPVLQKDARIRNTHGSTAIEGNPLTLEDVRLLEDGKQLPTATARSRREVLNYFAALRFIEKNAVKKTILEKDLLKLHKIISNDVMDQGKAGEFRKISVRVGHYLPPKPDIVPQLTRELLEWWNKSSSKWSPVISSAIIHYRFEAIHPFGDGNGRTGRALALWELYRRGFDTNHIFSIDEFFWEGRQKYYRALDQVRQTKDDLTGWLEYVAEGIHLTLERVLLRAQELSASIGNEKLVLRPKQEKLLALLRDKKSMSPKEIWEALDISRQGAMDLLKPLIKTGIIQKIGTKKSGKYVLK
ncbi:MAG: Fic family protein [Pseudomonadota bacterium]